MTKYSWLLLIVISLLTLSSCSDDEKANLITDPTDEDINDWIYETMSKYYLWYEDLPSKGALNTNADPEEFFYSLLSKKDGVVFSDNYYIFSSIEKKAEETKAIKENVPTYGFHYGRYIYIDNERIFALVYYVLPGSAAEKAGLKRGDWIMGIGENPTGIKDYTVLDKGDGITLCIGYYDETEKELLPAKTITIESAYVVDYNPFIKDTVFTVGGKRIGYLAYSRFASGPEGSNDTKYDDQMAEIFSRFKSEQVDEFVLDLRYNGGGLLSSATKLASYLAPKDILGKEFCTLEYNGKNTPKERTDYFLSASVAGTYNLDLSRLYVLTGNTASASEVVINGLLPYLEEENIIIIGQKTMGKDKGANSYEKKYYKYTLNPITATIVNSAGNGYPDGFAPNIEKKDIEWRETIYELGSPNERMLKTALYEITGVAGFRSDDSGTKKENLRFISSSIERYGTRLIID